MLEPLEGRVNVRRDIIFERTGSRDLRCDVYLPPREGLGRPAVLLIHGGGWKEGDRTQLQGYAVQFARRGLVSVACEYRLSAEAHWPAQLGDAEAALGWMTSRARELGLDPSRICALGASAGGHLALMLAGRERRLAAVIALYAPARLVPAGEDDPVSLLMGPGADGPAFERASPLHNVCPGFPPTQLIHGNRDDIVPCRDSLDLYLRLREAGTDAELHLYDGVPHAFDLDPDYGRQCVQLMALFLEKKLVARKPRRGAGAL